MKVVAHVILVALLFFSLAGLAQEKVNSDHYEGLLSSGNELYKKGNYEEAIKLYQEVLQADYVSSALLYNLGNAYYKNDNIPAAILYYEKAKKYSPQDKDIQFNLNLANERIVDKIDTLPTPFLSTVLQNIREIMGVDAWAIFGLLFGLISLLGFAIYYASRQVWLKKLGFIFLLTGVFLWLFGYLMARSSYTSVSQSEAAIVMQPTVTVKNGPTQSATDLFVIHEGLKVQFIENQDDWVKIALADGKIGWVPANFLEKI